MGTLERELQKIHDAGIGVSITSLWDGGVDMRLLREGGAVAEEGSVEEIAAVLPWLRRTIKKCFPNANYYPRTRTLPGYSRPNSRRSTTRKSTSKSLESAMAWWP